MQARRRALKFAAATAVAMLSGGVAWAASGVAVPTVTHEQAPDDSTTSSSTETTIAEPPTTEAPTTTTTEADHEDTTTTAPAKTPTSGQECKPGWGYGDTNHCHSGPPGLNKKDSSEKDLNDKSLKEKSSDDSHETDSTQND